MGWSQLEFDFTSGTITSWAGTPVGTTSTGFRWRRRGFLREYRDNEGNLILQTRTSGLSVWEPYQCTDAAGQTIGMVSWKDCQVNGVVVATNRQGRGNVTTSCAPSGDTLATVTPIHQRGWLARPRWRLEIEHGVEDSLRLLIVGLPAVCEEYSRGGD